MDRAFFRAGEIVRSHRDLVDAMVEELLVEEALEGPALERFLASPVLVS